MKRYKIIEGSQLGHSCCFDFTIVDTALPVMNADNRHLLINGQKRYKDVCECYGRDDAELICGALNEKTG